MAAPSTRPRTTDHKQRTALLLIAHGSREPDANADLHHLAEALRRQGEYAWVEAAFLELAEPDPDAGAARCLALGAQRVILLPYFLSAGVHVTRDLSAIRDRLTERHPHVEIQLAEPLGRHPLLMQIVRDRVREAEAATPAAAAKDR
jgi:sirohydrochlorin ferrochelatase